MDEWENQVVLALLALVKVDATAWSELAAIHFARVLAVERDAKQYRGYIPGLIHNCIETDECLLRNVVESTKTISRVSGIALAHMIAESLSEPGFVRQLGLTKVMSLRRLALDG